MKVETLLDYLVRGAQAIRAQIWPIKDFSILVSRFCCLSIAVFTSVAGLEIVTNSFLLDQVRNARHKFFIDHEPRDISLAFNLLDMFETLWTRVRSIEEILIFSGEDLLTFFKVLVKIWT